MTRRFNARVLAAPGEIQKIRYPRAVAVASMLIRMLAKPLDGSDRSAL
jgi:hypothetical protein